MFLLRMRRTPLLATLLLLHLANPARAFPGGHDSSDSDEDTHEVSFQGQHSGEHFTMEVEEGHRFKCFDTKHELQEALDKYQGYNHIDMELAAQYGWPIGNWCVGLLTDMSDLFYDRQHFDEDIGKWNVAKVTDMTAMFQNALEFNQDLSLWDTSSVTSMSRMFAAAKNFNFDISKWNTERVNSMSYMFLHALAFNQDISEWNMGQLKDRERMLRDARSFTFREKVEQKWQMIDNLNGDDNGEPEF